MHSSEESRGEGSFKQWKVTELPLLGGALVLDTLVGLLDEVIWFWEVKQHGKLILTGLGAVLGWLKEERIYPEQDLEEIN